jgi:hypothetical protein
MRLVPAHADEFWFEGLNLRFLGYNHPQKAYAVRLPEYLPHNHCNVHTMFILYGTAPGINALWRQLCFCKSGVALNILYL